VAKLPKRENMDPHGSRLALMEFARKLGPLESKDDLRALFALVARLSDVMIMDLCYDLLLAEANLLNALSATAAQAVREAS